MRIRRCCIDVVVLSNSITVKQKTVVVIQCFNILIKFKFKVPEQLAK